MRWTVIPSRSNKLSTANIQINFNTVHSPAHFFSKKTAFPYKSVALAPIALRSQPVPVGPFGAARRGWRLRPFAAGRTRPLVETRFIASPAACGFVPVGPLAPGVTPL